MVISVLAIALALNQLADGINAQVDPQYERETSEEISGGVALPLGPLKTQPDERTIRPKCVHCVPSPQTSIRCANVFESVTLNNSIGIIPSEPLHVVGPDNLVSVIKMRRFMSNLARLLVPVPAAGLWWKSFV